MPPLSLVPALLPLVPAAGAVACGLVARRCTRQKMAQLSRIIELNDGILFALDEDEQERRMVAAEREEKTYRSFVEPYLTARHDRFTRYAKLLNVAWGVCFLAYVATKILF